MRNLVTALVLISALVPWNARAQARCGHPDPEISISMCSAIIQSGRARGRALATAHTERGVAYVTLLDYDRALQDFAHAIQADATLAKAFANRGAVYGAKQEFDKAIDDFTRVLKLEPGSALAWADRAGMYRLDGRYEDAIHDYSEAIRLDPRFAEAILNRAIMLAGTSRCEEAIADFTRVLELSGSGNGTGAAIALIDRGACYEKLGRDDLAVTDYSAHLDIEPRSQLGLELRGALYFRARQYERALADFAQALVVNPSSPTALYSRGVVKRTMGDVRGGDEDVDVARAMRRGVVEEMAARGVK